ncbi:MAG: 1-acyl-sn-glycerol-3-phosphate acyltransferase [Nitrospirae bacterium]|nr:1-acyl-sn-glycerol-3-phosphate acyltransferase [Nitrospirota bacterium]MBI3593406.1 1-acyl-sn-glycerol-3-phosphate acyltransferase [Nitrospirota bacterium]
MILYRILQLIFLVIFKLFFKLKITGLEHIPRKGGAILASNHASYADILLIGIGLRRRLRYVAKAEMFKKSFVRALWTYLGGIPIRRHGVPRESFKRIFEQIDRGNLVVVFPEGTRSKDGVMKDPKLGIGMMVALSGARIIPTYISGSNRILPSHSRKLKIHPVGVTYGEPIDFSDLMKKFEGKELYQEISRRVMEKIQNLKVQ